MSSSSENARRATILLLEDNKDALGNLSLLPEIEGFAVVTAQNGLEGLEQLKTDRVSVVLLDLWMSVMNGWDFLQHKAEIDSIANIPVILLSALPISTRPEGVQSILQKPVRPKRLLDAIGSCLG